MQDPGLSLGMPVVGSFLHLRVASWLEDREPEG